jgi:3-hydroxyisobutyrate dehydrogenase-like beta-hydroxyacid dehydrogenase
MNIAVLGLGRMGHALASHLLQKEYEVTVWNRSAGKAQDLVGKGATEAGSVAEAVVGADVVMMSLADDAAVREVCFDRGAIGHLGDSATLVDSSTVSPETSRELAAAVPGGRFVDAPILGGPAQVEAGQASLVIGGPIETVRMLDNLWNDVASRYFYCGPNGTGTTIKLLSNFMLIGGTALLSEMVATAQANGVPDDILRDVFGESYAIAPAVRMRFENVLGHDHAGWFSVELSAKDVSLFRRLAQSVGLALPVASGVHDLMSEAIAGGHGDEDMAAVVEALRDQLR